jgi:hypothetical protein
MTLFFNFLGRRKKYMVRHVTFFNFNNKMTRREVFFLSVDNFSNSQNALAPPPFVPNGQRP